MGGVGDLYRTLRPQSRGPHTNPGSDGRVYIVVAKAENKPNEIDGPLYDLLGDEHFDDVLDLDDDDLVFVTASESSETAIERYRWFVANETEATVVGEPETYTADDLGIGENELLSSFFKSIGRKRYVGWGS